MKSTTQIIHCLYLEDDPESRETYKDLIELAWESQKTTIHLNVHVVPSPDKAVQELRLNPQKYGLFIADLLFGPKGQDDRGLVAIEAAKQVNPEIAVLAFSVTDKFPLVNKAKAKGADEFFSKLELAEESEAIISLGATMVRILSKSQPELIPFTPIKEESYKNDLQLAAVMEGIGPDIVSRLAAKILGKECEEVIPFFVRSGLSGAYVIRLDCRLAVDEQCPYLVESLLLKLSRDEKLISSELSKIEDIRAFPTGTFIPFAEEKVVSSGEWFAIAVDYKNAQTFLDWLINKDVSFDIIEGSLRALFLGDGLRSVYTRFRRRNDVNPASFIWETMLNASRRARIGLAWEEFAGLARTHGGLDDGPRQMVESFIRSKRVDDIDEEMVYLGTSVCTSHGDLHGRNILIDENNRANLIDPANIGSLHWAADLARLMVDLMVSGWDHGDKSHEWNNMNAWLHLSRSLLIGEIAKPSSDDHSSNARVNAALKWLRDNLFEIHKVENQTDKPEWEFRLALAVEFMRASYRQQDLPSPKRVFGLISACEALRAASSSFKDLELVKK